jgi:general secretion pathway protein A
MYTEYFGLNEKPFSISPDPRYLYLSQRHADALAHLLYGIAESGGFIQLTGEVGTGKTTLIRSVFGQLPEHTEIALILNPQLSTKQFLQAICQELHVEFLPRDTARQLIDHLNGRLLELHAAAKRAVLIVDEAQTMSPELLEQVRLLTNLETSQRKLLQIILIGQPELREMLARPGMRQVAQRITGRYHLEPLSAADTAIYVSHRLRVAGGRPGIFDKRAMRQLFRLSQGIPRLINVIADRALLAAYTLESTQVGASLVRRAAGEVFGQRRRTRWWPWAASAAGLALVAIVAGTLLDQGIKPSLTLALLETETAPATESVLPADAGRAPAVQATAASRAPTLLEVIAASDIELATATLFRLWGTAYVPGGSPVCDQAEAHGLRCLPLENVSLDGIRELGLPALVELALPALLDFGDADGLRGAVLLPGPDASVSTLLDADSKRRFATAELAQVATGKAFLLFRPAIMETGGALVEGARSHSVVWLRTVLAEQGGAPLASEDPLLFDAALTAALRSFQAQQGLSADGVLTDRTLASLQAAIGLVGFDPEQDGR